MRNVRTTGRVIAASVALLLVAACGKDEKPMGGKWAQDPPWKACETADCSEPEDN